MSLLDMTEGFGVKIPAAQMEKYLPFSLVFSTWNGISQVLLIYSCFPFSLNKYHSGCFVCKVAWWALARGAAWSATLGLLQTAKSHRLSDGCLVLFLGLGISRQGPATSKCDATDATAYTVVN